jgi:hypothetical protein
LQITAGDGRPEACPCNATGFNQRLFTKYSPAYLKADLRGPVLIKDLKKNRKFYEKKVLL